MFKSKDGIRKIYVLPPDLAAAVTQAQIRMGVSSEVEAVRALLWDALGKTETALEFKGRVTQAPPAERLSMIVGHASVTQIAINETRTKADFWFGDDGPKSVHIIDIDKHVRPHGSLCDAA